jgi:hypothetical protein
VHSRLVEPLSNDLLVEPLSNDLFAGGLYDTTADVVAFFQERPVAHALRIVAEVQVARLAQLLFGRAARRESQPVRGQVDCS